MLFVSWLCLFSLRSTKILLSANNKDPTKSSWTVLYNENSRAGVSLGLVNSRALDNLKDPDPFCLSTLPSSGCVVAEALGTSHAAEKGQAFVFCSFTRKRKTFPKIAEIKKKSRGNNTIHIVSNLTLCQNHWKGLLKQTLLACILRAPGSVCLGWACELELLISTLLVYHACMQAKLLLSCPTLCNPMDHSLPGSIVPGILQARILEWVAMSSSMGSSWPSDWTHFSYVSYIGRWIL